MRCIYLFCIVLFIASCDIFSTEDESAIRNLSFTRSDRFQEPYNSYAAGTPLVLTAISFPSEFKKPARVNVFSSSGQFSRVSLFTLYKIPAHQLATIIDDHDGSAIVTVKEADRKYAMDRDTFLYTTSQQTLLKVWNWIDEMEGVEVVNQIINSPVLVLQMTPTAELVDAIRGSDNVEILEPNSRVFLLGGSQEYTLIPKMGMTSNQQQISQSRTENPISVMGVIFTTTDEATGQFYVQPGDTISASYSHPDGRVLTTQSVIK